MPISKFQSDVLRLLAAQRSPDSYIAGGIAINRQGPRFSADVDIFHDSIARQESAVKAPVFRADFVDELSTPVLLEQQSRHKYRRV